MNGIISNFAHVANNLKKEGGDTCKLTIFPRVLLVTSRCVIHTRGLAPVLAVQPGFLIYILRYSLVVTLELVLILRFPFGGVCGALPIPRLLHLINIGKISPLPVWFASSCRQDARICPQDMTSAEMHSVRPAEEKVFRQVSHRPWSMPFPYWVLACDCNDF